MVHVTGSQRDELSKLSASRTPGTVAYIDCCLPCDRAFPKNAFLLEAATSIIRCDFCRSPQHLSLAAYAVIARRVCRYFFCRWPTITYADSHSLSSTHTHTLSSSSHSAILHGHSSSNVFFFALIVRIITYIVRPWLHVISRC